MKKITIFVFLMLAFFFLSYASGEEEIVVEPKNAIMDVGASASFTITINVIHSNCPLTIDDTRIIVPDIIGISSQTPWEKTDSNSYQKTITFAGKENGSDYLVIRRDSPRFGLIEKKVPIAVGMGELPSQREMPGGMQKKSYIFRKEVINKQIPLKQKRWKIR
ncbi:MAG: hypothetical protein ACXQTP_04070 [Candidatus Methanofastidiosia archaeon]